MNVLGIGGYSHDSAAALVCDGVLVAACAEERFTRVKHDGGIPGTRSSTVSMPPGLGRKTWTTSGAT